VFVWKPWRDRRGIREGVVVGGGGRGGLSGGLINDIDLKCVCGVESRVEEVQVSTCRKGIYKLKRQLM
jgi:hypothetical protein